MPVDLPALQGGEGGGGGGGWKQMISVLYQQNSNVAKSIFDNLTS